jgi:hypothetical protein
MGLKGGRAMGFYEFLCDVRERFSDEVSEVSLENSWVWITIKFNKYLFLAFMIGMVYWIFSSDWLIKLVLDFVYSINTIFVLVGACRFKFRSRRRLFFYLLYAAGVINLLLLVNPNIDSSLNLIALVVFSFLPLIAVIRFLNQSTDIKGLPELLRQIWHKGFRRTMTESIVRCMVIVT